jgi:hypothetical protein
VIIVLLISIIVLTLKQSEKEKMMVKRSQLLKNLKLSNNFRDLITIIPVAIASTFAYALLYHSSYVTISESHHAPMDSRIMHRIS